MAFLHFPLSEKEMDCLSEIEKQIQLHPDVFPLPEEVIHDGINLIREMVAHGIIKDAGIDNCNAYYVTGSIVEFKKWIHDNNGNANSKTLSKWSTAMAFEPLSYNCERLLKDIIDHRSSSGMCDIQYWENRFHGLSFPEESVLRSQFDVLVKRNMISVFWADDIPFTMSLLEEGLSYFEQKDYALQATQLDRKAQSPVGKDYDVFISHADKDKLKYVDDLYNGIKLLGIRIFYDKDTISWGDNWKQTILDGTQESEFAIIVISSNFFGREWTERELKEFMHRQNASGQKIVLPLLYDISVEDMKKQYPFLEDIQAIETINYSKEEIAILLAREIIKRMR